MAQSVLHPQPFELARDLCDCAVSSAKTRVRRIHSPYLSLSPSLSVLSVRVRRRGARVDHGDDGTPFPGPSSMAVDLIDAIK